MEYRELENLGINTSLLGFGCMRFPELSNGKINEKEAEKMLNKAIEEGVNYFDTAYPYHDGDSELLLGKVLKKYNRDTFYLATKSPIWEIKKIEDVERIFQEQLRSLQTDYIDFYLLHGLDNKNWNKVKDLGIIKYFEGLKEKGIIKFFGFSFHDEYKIFKEILNYRRWDFCQIQLNYMDINFQAGMKGYKLAEKLDIPLVIMEPIKGGALAKVPKDVKRVLNQLDNRCSTASWALRWVATLPNVKVVLSGMSKYGQLLDNLRTFKNFKPLSKKEEKALVKTREAFKKYLKNDCTGCGYCMPCKYGVDIPKCFRIWNDLGRYSNLKQLQYDYWLKFEGKRGDQCKECGECEDKCPQHISIRKDLKLAAEDLEKIRPRKIK